MKTDEQRREYMKKWREANKEKIKESRRENMRRKALDSVKNVIPEAVDMCIIKTRDGCEYHVARRRR